MRARPARYLVTGRQAYREHKPGEEFDAALDAGAESRALLRGDIKVIDRYDPCLPPDYELPRGWIQPT